MSAGQENRLRRERLARRWTLRTLAAHTGIFEPDLSLIERGLRPAFPGWRRRLARALRVSEATLFGEGFVTTPKVRVQEAGRCPK
jgi:transcriptional regulator with XRE-family HTH domain